jgi:hypothetical protein
MGALGGALGGSISMGAGFGSISGGGRSSGTVCAVAVCLCTRLGKPTLPCPLAVRAKSSAPEPLAHMSERNEGRWRWTGSVSGCPEDIRCSPKKDAWSRPKLWFRLEGNSDVILLPWSLCSGCPAAQVSWGGRQPVCLCRLDACELPDASYRNLGRG